MGLKWINNMWVFMGGLWITCVTLTVSVAAAPRNLVHVVYKANVRQTSDPEMFYIDSTILFKQRSRAHMSTFSNRKYSSPTIMASYIHQLRVD